MSFRDPVLKTINSYFLNEEFILNELLNYPYFSHNAFDQMMNQILCYYLSTRDTKKYKSIGEIEYLLNQIEYEDVTDEMIHNLIDLGYVTHSFPGSLTPFIKKYGFNYNNKISSSKRDYLENMKKSLQLLETVQKCQYIFERERKSKLDISSEVFISVPGTKTIYYSENVPERFYEGPIKSENYSNFPMIVGESKTDYLLRILNYNIIKSHKKINITQKELREVIDFFSSPSNIAFIKYAPLLTKNVSEMIYHYSEENSLANFRDFIIKKRPDLYNCFTTEMEDDSEIFEIGNLVVKNTDIGIEDFEITSFPDIYHLKQQYALQKGKQEGSMIEFYNCEYAQDLDENIIRLYK